MNREKGSKVKNLQTRIRAPSASVYICKTSQLMKRLRVLTTALSFRSNPLFNHLQFSNIGFLIHIHSGSTRGPTWPWRSVFSSIRAQVSVWAASAGWKHCFLIKPNRTKPWWLPDIFASHLSCCYITVQFEYLQRLEHKPYHATSTFSYFPKLQPQTLESFWDFIIAKQLRMQSWEVGGKLNKVFKIVYKQKSEKCGLLL